MSNNLFMEERRRAILDELQKYGRVSVKSLSDRLNVSAVTIRQDLRSLESDGQLERTYGGAVLMNPGATAIPPELSFATRQKQQREEKQAIGKAAARMVENGYAIALDASTTAFAIVPFLKQLDDLIIVTNSLIVAQQFLDTPRIQVQMPAGIVRNDSASLV
ncbi:MAG TPA: DeoR/GlpR family DNA-binding transcription regulator, partial [Aggregatilineales bacterium]|nr:DeoR/GlpR family DNA-binding transcription regulator [Aggregatilineales bacterium]